MERAGLPRKEAAHYVGAKLSTFERQVRQGKMPKPRLLGDRIVVWLRTELDEALKKLPVSDLPPGPGAKDE